MKKFLVLLAGLIAVTVINAQTLEEIVKNYSSANKLDKLESISTIKITGSMSAMGMEIPMEMLMKRPDKIKSTLSINGMEMISAYDGEKGYTINPMTGSTDPVELTGEQLNQVKTGNAFSKVVLNYFKNGQLTLEGVENVNDKPAFKLKVNDGISPKYLFIDKGSYYMVKTSATVDQMGTSVNVDTYMSDFVDINGLVINKKTTAFMNGMESGVYTTDKVEVNIPIDDSIFKIK